MPKKKLSHHENIQPDDTQAASHGLSTSNQRIVSPGVLAKILKPWRITTGDFNDTFGHIAENCALHLLNLVEICDWVMAKDELGKARETRIPDTGSGSRRLKYSDVDEAIKAVERGARSIRTDDIQTVNTGVSTNEPKFVLCTDGSAQSNNAEYTESSKPGEEGLSRAGTKRTGPVVDKPAKRPRQKQHTSAVQPSDGKCSHTDTQTGQDNTIENPIINPAKPSPPPNPSHDTHLRSGSVMGFSDTHGTIEIDSGDDDDEQPWTPSKSLFSVDALSRQRLEDHELEPDDRISCAVLNYAKYGNVGIGAVGPGVVATPLGAFVYCLAPLDTKTLIVVRWRHEHYFLVVINKGQESVKIYDSKPGGERTKRTKDFLHLLYEKVWPDDDLPDIVRTSPIIQEPQDQESFIVTTQAIIIAAGENVPDQLDVPLWIKAIIKLVEPVTEEMGDEDVVDREETETRPPEVEDNRFISFPAKKVSSDGIPEFIFQIAKQGKAELLRKQKTYDLSSFVFLIFQKLHSAMKKSSIPMEALRRLHRTEVFVQGQVPPKQYALLEKLTAITKCCQV